MIDIDSKKVSSITLIALFILSIFAMYPVIKVAPARANPTYITVSSDYLGEYNLLLVEIKDAGATSTPQIEVYQGTTFIGSGYLNKTLISGTYALFLAYDSEYGNKTLTWNGANILVVNMSKQSSDPYGGSGGIANFTVTTAVNIGPSQDDLTIKYVQRNEEVTVHARDSKVSFVSVDRETIPPGAVIYMNVSDPTANVNVTTADFYNNEVILENYTITLKHYSSVQTPLTDVKLNATGKGIFNITSLPTGTSGYIGVGTINETGANTGVFTIKLDLAEVGWSSTLMDGDTVEVVLNDSQGGTITKDFTVKVTDATVSLSSSSLDFTNPITVTVNDFDRNNDSAVNESIYVTINATKTDIKSPGTTSFYLNETGTNTGVFTGKIYLNLTATVSTISNITKGGIIISANSSLFQGAAFPAFNVTYDDILYSHSSLKEQNMTFTLSPASPSVAWDKSTYDFTGLAKIKFTLPTANDNSTLRDLLNVTIGKLTPKNQTAELNHTTPNLQLGKFNISVYNSTAKAWVPLYLNGSNTPVSLWNYDECIVNGSMPFETEVDTGVFYLTVNLTALNLTAIEPFKSGTYINVTYVDYFSNNTLVSAKASIGGTMVGKVSLDRSVYPVNPDENVKAHITVEDADQNADPGTIDHFNVTVYYKRASDGVLENKGQVTLYETGKDTGVFTGTYSVNISAYKHNNKYDLIGGGLVVNYTEPLAANGYVTANATFEPNTGSLSLSSTSVSMNDTLTITLNEPDLNIDSEANDTATIWFGSSTLTLTETNVSTGIFKAVYVVGDNLTVTPGTTYAVSYLDNATTASNYANGFISDNISKTLSVVAHDAEVVVGKTSYTPFEIVYVNVTDPDLALKSASDVKITYTSLNTPAPGADVKAYNKTDSTFMFKIPLSTSVVNTTDTLYIYFTDEYNAAGKTVTITKTVTIAPTSGELTLDKSSYNVGEYINITINDFDRNENPKAVDNIWAIVKSDSFPQGVNITLYETGKDTGLFNARVKVIGSGIPSGYEILAKSGDTITVQYTDPYNSGGFKEKFTATATVGVPKPTYPVPASTPKLVTSNGTVVVNATVGTQVFINATYTNNWTKSQYVVVFVRIVDSEGHPVYLGTHISPALSAGKSASELFGWTPTQSGTYTIKISVKDKFFGGKLLSQPVEITVTVTEAST